MLKPSTLNQLITAVAIFASMPSIAATWCMDTKTERLTPLRNEAKQKLLPTSRAVERVHTEGTLPHQGIWDQSIEAEKDWPVMRDLALLWQGQHQPDDLVVLSRLLTDWGTQYQPSFNPIDETNLDAYIDAYAIAHDALAPGDTPHRPAFYPTAG